MHDHPDHPDRPVDADQEHGSRPAATRRSALRALIAAAGATAGAVAVQRGDALAGDDDLADVNGNAVELGESNTSDDPTAVVYDGVTPIQDGSFRGVSLFYAGDEVPGGSDDNDQLPGAIGGYGKGNLPNGVHGSTVNRIGYGVVAANFATTSTAAQPNPKGLGVASASGSQIHFVPLPGAVVGPTPGGHVRGELYVDAAGTMWFSVPDGGDIRWVRLADASSAGSYHPVAPYRAYDSRQPGYVQQGPLLPNERRRIGIADAHASDGTTTTSDVIPAGATAAHVNVTVVAPSDVNFVAVAAGDETSTTTSAVNWSDGDVATANALTVPIASDRSVAVFMGDQFGSGDVIVDVFGYYA